MVLVINGVKVKTLSGPVSFLILKPVDKVKSFPSIILLGDYHNSDKHQCESCESGDCYAIYSKRFLSLIDSPNVDFYVENWVDRADKSEEYFKYMKEHHNYPLELIREEIIACYYKELRGKKIYNKYCPTKNIRWHLSDPRYAVNSYEHFLSIIEMEFLKKLKKDITKGAIDEQIISKIIKRHYNKDYKLFIDSLKTMKLMLDYKNPEAFVDHYFSSDNNYFLNNSLVYKQLKKQLNQFYYWKRNFMVYYKTVIIPFSIKTAFYNDKVSIDDVIDTYNRILYLIETNNIRELKTINIEHIKRLTLYMVALCSCFLDMYFVLRNFKYQETGVITKLSLGYFGDAHVDNITILLTNILKLYTVSGKTDTKKVEKNDYNKCLELPDIFLVSN